MTQIETLKSNPLLEYVDGCIYEKGVDDKPLVDEQTTKGLIEEFYDNSYITRQHWSKDPQQEYEEKVDGDVYVRDYFSGDYEEAYQSI